MEPIVTVHSFNDAYAELAAVSITSLVHNTERDCDIHIFESSVSQDVMAKVLSIQDKYTNARITVHHIPDGAFAEVADKRFGKETWYPLLAPEILGGLDRALVLEPDTLVCRDLSELFDMELGGAPMACHFDAADPSHYFNAGVLLFNLRVLRESGFGMERIIEAVHAIRPRYADNNLTWYAQDSYLNRAFGHGNLARFDLAYNWLPSTYIHVHRHAAANGSSEDVSDPAIVHFAGFKPNDKFYAFWPGHTALLLMLRKWWDCHALSPFADPKRDAERLEEIIEVRSNMEDAIKGLKRLQAEGAKIVFYGAGFMGAILRDTARPMGLSPDKVCDLNKRGAALGGVPIEHPDALKSCGADAVVALTIADPQSLLDAKDTLLGLGIPENRVLPIFELALGGWRLGGMLGAVAGD